MGAKISNGHLGLKPKAMKVFVIVTGASQALGRALGLALCDEASGVTHLRAMLVDENLKSLESTGIAMKQKAVACKVMLSMYQMDINDTKSIDQHVDDLLVEASDKFDKIVLIQAQRTLGPIAPLLKMASVDQLKDATPGSENSVGPSWLTVRFVRFAQAHKLGSRATVAHLSLDENVTTEIGLPLRGIHHPCTIDTENYEQASVLAQELTKLVLQPEQ